MMGRYGRVTPPKLCSIPILFIFVNKNECRHSDMYRLYIIPGSNVNILFGIGWNIVQCDNIENLMFSRI